MSTPQDSQQLDIVDVSIENGSQRQHTTTGQKHHPATTITSSGSHQEEETAPLLRTVTTRKYFAKVKSKFRGRNCCIKSSKAAFLVLAWNFILSFGMLGFLDPSWYTVLFDNGFINAFSRTVYGFSAFLLLFYPLAGCLADIRCGRHKTVVNSLCAIFWSLVLIIVLGIVAAVSFIPVMIQSQSSESESYPSNTIQIVALVVVCVWFGLPVFIALVLLLGGLVSFNANVIQYGMDQLRDAPTDDSILYIHWYVWTTFAGFLIIRLPTANSIVSVFILMFLPIAALILLGITLCIQKYKRNWFIVDMGSRNPYKLVFKVLKFAKDHTNPIRRSAFTYCEDELPSRLDLGKEKYGGPFKTEEVENVKAFVGILGILLTTGPLFTADIAFNDIVPIAGTKNFDDGSFFSRAHIYINHFLTPLIVVVVIPFYLFLLRPFISDYIPGMLKRMGLGMVLFFVSGLCSLLMGAITRDCIPSEDSFIDNCEDLIGNYLKISPNYLLIQYVFNAFGSMLFYIAIFEFICAQSPHSMKGLLIGTYYAIKGVFQLLGVLVIYVPMTAWCKLPDHSFPICGFIYYLVNVVILLIGMISFIFVARKYQYRQRDEPDNIYRYAEEYYTNAQDEPNYDYSNLNVETIKD